MRVVAIVACAGVIVLSPVALAGFEYRPPVPAQPTEEPAEAATDPVESAAAPAVALPESDPDSSARAVAVPVAVSSASASAAQPPCVAGLHLEPDSAAAPTLPARRGSGTWSSLIGSFGTGWVATGPLASTKIVWAHGAESAHDALDRIARMNRVCVVQRGDVLQVLAEGSSITAAPNAEVAKPAPLAVASAASVPPAPVVVAAAVPAAAELASTGVEPAVVTDPGEYQPELATPPWVMERGETLRECLQRWAARAGHTVVWEPAFDLRIEVAATFPGDREFNEVVETVLRSYWRSGEKLRGRYFLANRVLLVTVEE